MSVYAKESPTYLGRAIRSLAEQTLPPGEIILVEDGPLPKFLYSVIEKWQSRLPLRIVPLAKNQGLGMALQMGLSACSYPIIARMDSDDICHPQRFATQIQFLKKHPEIDVVGSWISEFEGDESNIYAYRTLPESPEDLSRFARKRNPLNHMSVMFRRDKVIEVGGYGQSVFIQDYHLWARMLLHGSRIANIPECLVNVRAGENMIRRRGGKRYAKIEFELQKEFLQMGFINPGEFLRNVLIRYGIRMIPEKARKQVYKLLRS